MEYISVAKAAVLWNVSERSVRNYCLSGKIRGAYMLGKRWQIPSDAIRPKRVTKKSVISNNLTNILKAEKENNILGSIYHKTQIELTYFSNLFKGCDLSREQILYIFETNTVKECDKEIIVSDIIETVNHFHCIDFIIDHANTPLSEKFIKKLHFILKAGTLDHQKSWLNLGNYKNYNLHTDTNENVSDTIQDLLCEYNKLKNVTLRDIINFHCQFEKLGPFCQANGRIGRLLMFKECLKNNIVPFIIEYDLKDSYYEQIEKWPSDEDKLFQICLDSQETYRSYLKTYNIKL